MTREALGRIAGIDYGTVRIGVAICDSRQTLASPFDIYQRRGQEADAEYFRRLARDERLTKFVVGLPIHNNGEESQKSHEAREFGAWLQATVGLPVEFFDERYTSVEAAAHLQTAGLTKKRRKARMDKVAAQILLSAYLESGDAGVRGATGSEAAAAPGPLDDRDRRRVRGWR